MCFPNDVYLVNLHVHQFCLTFWYSNKPYILRNTLYLLGSELVEMGFYVQTVRTTIEKFLIVQEKQNLTFN